MSEVHRPSSVNIISTDAVTIRIEGYSSVMGVIERSGFDTTLIDREYLQNETQFIKRADFILQPGTAEYPMFIDTSIVFDDASSKTHTQLANFVYNRLRQHYEEELIQLNTSTDNLFIVITQISGSCAVLEVNRIDDATAIVSMRIPLAEMEDLQSIHEEVYQALETWGILHDAIEFDGPPPKHSKAREHKPMITISDYDSLRPESGSWSLWQQFLNYDSWQREMNEDTLPAIDYDDVNVSDLGNLFGPLTDEFVLKALQEIAKSKLAERDRLTLSAALPISQLDIVNEFARRLR